MISRRATLAGLGAVGLAACSTRTIAAQSVVDPSNPSIETLSPDLSRYVDADASIETLSTGYQWSEGPTWDRARSALYFTDVPQNKAFRWRRDAPVNVFMDPSGAAETDGFREPGANGLWYASDGSLLICNHGHRAGERMDLETGEVTSLAKSFAGKKLNSPNDLVQARIGEI